MSDNMINSILICISSSCLGVYIWHVKYIFNKKVSDNTTFFKVLTEQNLLVPGNLLHRTITLANTPLISNMQVAFSCK